MQNEEYKDVLKLWIYFRKKVENYKLKEIIKFGDT